LIQDILILGLSVWFDRRQPHKLCVAWMRHGRRLCSEVHSWESTFDDPYRGEISWSVPENITATVTLFHTGRVAKCEDKKWMFVVENVSKAVALVIYNMSMLYPLLLSSDISRVFLAESVIVDYQSCSFHLGLMSV